MCGICGFYGKEEISLDELTAMNNSMIHRGPDDSGQEIYSLGDGYYLGLAQRRLSIIDLSQAGHQPMHSCDKRISVVFNGEIYNFKEIRQQLQEYHFVSNCDTEVIIAAYLKWGISCVEQFNGMFAIALFDREDNSLYLIRDRIGKKPLYYLYKNNEIVFGSELKAIMACHCFDKDIDTSVIGRYIANQYINAPDTIFNDVYKLEPGSILKLHDGIIEINKYWDISGTYNKEIIEEEPDYNTVKSELKNRLIKSVDMRMISDVPIGCFLSGGYDSTLIASIAQSISDEPINTFSIGFEEKEWNEAIYAKEIADYLHTNHTEMYINEKDLLDQIDSIPVYYDEPFADPSLIPTMLLSKMTKEYVTVALSGDGGDEFFCGYNSYDYVKKAQNLDNIGNILHKLLIPSITDKLPVPVASIINNRDIESKTQFTNYGLNKASANMVLDKKEIEYKFESRYNVDDWQIRRMLLDMDTYLPGDVLCKVDRASMKYSLEARCPILDKDVMEYSFRIPQKYKNNNGEKKYILKDIAYDYVPKEMLDREKHGFSVPLDKWLKNALKERIMYYSTYEYLNNQKIFDPVYVEKFINSYLSDEKETHKKGENYARIVWSYFLFQLWYEKYM